MTTKLTDIKTDEVSLVGRGANRKRFLLFKSKEGTMEELIKELLEETKAIDGEADVLAGLKADGVSESDASTVQAALRLFGQLADKIRKSKVVRKALGAETKEPPKIDAKATGEFLKNSKPEVRAEIAKSAGLDEKRFGEVFVPEKKETGGILKADGTLDEEKVPAELRPALSHLFKDSTDTKAKLKKAEEDIEKNRVEKQRAVFLKKAEEFKDLPGTNVAELAETLMKLDDADAEKIIKQLRASLEVIEKSDFFTEHGRPGSGGGSGSAIERVNTLAKGLIQKNDKLLEADAIAQVLRENPSLYTEYTKETQIRA